MTIAMKRPEKITIGETAPAKPRRFMRPWSVTERDGAYEVRDAAGLNLATVHFEDQPAPNRTCGDYQRTKLAVLLLKSRGCRPCCALRKVSTRRKRSHAIGISGRRHQLYNHLNRTARYPPNSSAGPARTSGV
jgi:hypothetical protein